MKIHPTAVVDSRADLGGDVEIGPGSIVGPAVKIGAETIVQAHVVIEGAVTIGSGNFIGHGAVIGATPQDLSFSPQTKSGVEIGDKNVIREYCTIHRGTADGSTTKIRDRNYLMVGVHLGHNCEIGSDVIIANNCLLGGYVRVDDRAFLGGGCLFHQFMHVGRLALTQGASAFGKDLPPFVIGAKRNTVCGLNVIGLRRAGISAKDRDAIKAAFKLVYLSGLNLTQALAQGGNFEGFAREFVDFVASAKKRGICPYKQATDEENDFRS